MSAKRKEWVNCLPPNVLRQLIHGFPDWRPLSIGHNLNGEGSLLAYVLFMAGAKTFNFSIGWMGGDESNPENIRIHTNSVKVTPYIKCPINKDRPLLWTLMKKSQWGFSGGGAGEDGNYMQAGTKHAPWKETEKTAELFKSIVTFQEFVNRFPR